MYRHKSQLYEARTFVRKCYGSVACNCGVAARIEDDIILINYCKEYPESTLNVPPTIQMFLNGELTPGTYLKELVPAKKYEVCLLTD